MPSYRTATERNNSRRLEYCGKKSLAQTKLEPLPVLKFASRGLFRLARLGYYGTGTVDMQVAAANRTRGFKAATPAQHRAEPEGVIVSPHNPSLENLACVIRARSC